MNLKNAKLKSLLQNSLGVTTVVELMTALGIVIAIILIYFFAASNLYDIYERTDLDLDLKSNDIMEKLVSSPGKGAYDNPDWERDPNNVTDLGLGVSMLYDYGIVSFDSYNVTPTSRSGYFSDEIGPDNGANCFLAGTNVLMSDNSYKAIESISAGFKVKSYDFKTKKMVNATVLDVLIHHPEEMQQYYLVINNVLKVTPNHLVYINGFDWVSFDKLQVGDQVSGVVIKSIEKIYTQEITYDLSIARNHCYFVSLSDDNLLVHNEQIFSSNYWKPWVLTSKYSYAPAIFDNSSFYPYGGDFYISYENISSKDEIRLDLDSNSFIYQVRDNSGSVFPVIDYNKLMNLSGINYENAKDALGLDSLAKSYNFQISIWNESSEIAKYGADFVSTMEVSSSSKKILIYHAPHIPSASEHIPALILNPPEYRFGKLVVYVFHSGILPA